MSRQSREKGYNLIALVMAITVINILVAASLPLWSKVIQREKEEELIFRGLQYAEAIRIFHNRFQRYPNRLEELVELEPRSIRQLWKDPMTEDGKWGLVFQNQGGPLTGQPGPDQRPPRGRQEDPEGRGGDDEGEEESTFGPKEGEEVQIGPIIGVRSKSPKASNMAFFGRERYDEWQFTEQMVIEQMSVGRVGGQGFAAPTGTPPTMTTRYVGRPLPAFMSPPGGGLPQDGTLPDGTRPTKPNDPRRRPGPSRGNSPY